MVGQVYFNTNGVALDIGRGAEQVSVRHNTIVGADHCVRIAGLDPSYALNPRPEVIFRDNIVVGCHYEALLVSKGVRLDPDNIRGNVMWNAPTAHFENLTGGIDYYQSECTVGLGSCATPGVLHDLHNASFVPADIQADPRVISWNEESEDFLSVQRDGAAAADAIGAGPPGDFAHVRKTPPCANMLVNSGFDTGMYGWRGGGDYDFSRYSNGSGWRIVKDDCERPPCLHVFSGLQGADSIPVQIRSFASDVDRGQGIGVRFRARALPGSGALPGHSNTSSDNATATFDVCLFVPSWQDRSSVCRRLKVTATGAWATYSASDWVTLDKTASAALPTWFPSIASVKFVSDAALFELLEGI